MRSREPTLDALRGLVIVLALLEHYTGFMNGWYLGRFREAALLPGLYAPFRDLVGRPLAMDDALHWLAVVFIPWVSHAYIFLAAANLPRRGRAEFARVYPAKMRFYALLFVAFTGESMLVAHGFGQAFTLGPTQVWTMLLALLATAYRFGGAAGAAFLFIVSWARFLLPLEQVDAAMQDWVAGAVHPFVRFDATPDEFLGSAAAGFLLGYVFHRLTGRVQRRAAAALGALALVGIGIYWVAMPAYEVSRVDVYRTEHVVAEHGAGMAGIVGILLLLGLAVMAFDRTRHARPVPLLGWAGSSILTIYLTHKVFFIFAYMPVREYVAARTGWLPAATMGEMATAAVAALVFVWFGQASGLFGLLTERKHG